MPPLSQQPIPPEEYQDHPSEACFWVFIILLCLTIVGIPIAIWLVDQYIQNRNLEE